MIFSLLRPAAVRAGLAALLCLAAQAAHADGEGHVRALVAFRDQFVDEWAPPA